MYIYIYIYIYCSIACYLTSCLSSAGPDRRFVATDARLLDGVTRDEAPGGGEGAVLV